MAKDMMLEDKKFFSLSKSTQDLSSDGSLILNKKSEAQHQYITRFRVQRDLQHEETTGGVILQACCPCCFHGQKSASKGKMVWHVIRSEPFLLFLQVSALVIGVAKAAAPEGIIGYDLEVIHSVLETLIGTAVIIIRIISAVFAYKDLKNHRKKFEVITDMHILKEHNKGVKRGLISLSILGILLMIFIWAILFIFLFVTDSLGWTILTTTFVLLSMMVSSNMYMARVSSESNHLSQDHYKTVIYESILLTCETEKAQSTEEKEQVSHKVQRFVQALLAMPMFKQPDYITCPEKYLSDWQAMTRHKPEHDTNTFVVTT